MFSWDQREPGPVAVPPVLTAQIVFPTQNWQRLFKHICSCGSSQEISGLLLSETSQRSLNTGKKMEGTDRTAPKRKQTHISTWAKHLCRLQKVSLGGWRDTRESFYGPLRVPLTGPLRNGHRSDPTSIFTWQSKHQKVPLQAWSLRPAAMWATSGMHKHSPSKQPSRKVHGNTHTTPWFVSRRTLFQFPFLPSIKSDKPNHYWRMTHKSALNRPDKGLLLYITQ